MTAAGHRRNRGHAGRRPRAAGGRPVLLLLLIQRTGRGPAHGAIAG